MKEVPLIAWRLRDRDFSSTSPVMSHTHERQHHPRPDITRRNLAVLAGEREDFAEVGRLWSDVLAECPGDREALARLERPRMTMPASREA